MTLHRGKHSFYISFHVRCHLCHMQRCIHNRNHLKIFLNRVDSNASRLHILIVRIHGFGCGDVAQGFVKIFPLHEGTFPVIADKVCIKWCRRYNGRCFRVCCRCRCSGNRVLIGNRRYTYRCSRLLLRLSRLYRRLRLSRINDCFTLRRFCNYRCGLDRRRDRLSVIIHGIVFVIGDFVNVELEESLDVFIITNITNNVLNCFDRRLKSGTLKFHKVVVINGINEVIRGKSINGNVIFFRNSSHNDCRTVVIDPCGNNVKTKLIVHNFF